MVISLNVLTRMNSTFALIVTFKPVMPRILFAEILANTFPAGFLLHVEHAIAENLITCACISLCSCTCPELLPDERGAEQAMHFGTLASSSC